mgnify:CR=1 FL=1
MSLEVGKIIDGKVTGVTNFGAFVDIGGGKKGLVHISEVARNYVKDINEHLTLNQRGMGSSPIRRTNMRL